MEPGDMRRTIGSVLGVVGVLLLGLAAVTAGVLPLGGAEPRSEVALAPATAAPPVLEVVDVAWAPERPVQGTLFEVRLTGLPEGTEDLAGEFAGEPLHFREWGDGERVAVAAAPIEAEGELELQLTLPTSAGMVERRTIPIEIVPGDYRMERLTVAPRYAGGDRPPELRERIAAEAARARAVSAASHETPRMWEPPFVAPRESTITSGFGHGRIFNEEVQSRHMGTDFRGAVGAPILAPAHGIVALVDSFYLGGNVIYIDHGAGLVTGYLHLSAQEVAEGDRVEPGQVIGRVGSTGRVTGPHLHWIVRYGGVTVDGMSLLELYGS